MRLAHHGIQTEVEGGVGDLRLLGMERTYQKVIILTFCKVHLTQKDIQIHEKCKVVNIKLLGMEHTSQKVTILTF